MGSNRYFEDEAIENLLHDARLVVFDLNGLILSDEPLQIVAANAVLEKYGLRFDEQIWTRRFFGRRSSDYFSEIMRETGHAVTPSFVKTLVAEKDGIYQNLLGQNLQRSIFSGAVAFIRYLHQLGNQSLALATSSSREELQCAMGAAGPGMFELFRVVVCGEDVVHGKPNPEIYQRVATLSGVAPASALVFEDSAIGVRAAVGAGMPAVAVPNRFTISQDFTGARMIISDLTPQAKAINSRRIA